MLVLLVETLRGQGLCQGALALEEVRERDVDVGRVGVPQPNNFRSPLVPTRLIQPIEQGFDHVEVGSATGCDDGVGSGVRRDSEWYE